jgi:fumarate reductase flavoprotein subunit
MSGGWLACAGTDMRRAHGIDDNASRLASDLKALGGFHGNAYMAGSALGKAPVFGQIAARTALAA